MAFTSRLLPTKHAGVARPPQPPGHPLALRADVLGGSKWTSQHCSLLNTSTSPRISSNHFPRPGDIVANTHLDFFHLPPDSKIPFSTSHPSRLFTMRTTAILGGLAAVGAAAPLLTYPGLHTANGTVEAAAGASLPPVRWVGDVPHRPVVTPRPGGQVAGRRSLVSPPRWSPSIPLVYLPARRGPAGQRRASMGRRWWRS